MLAELSVAPTLPTNQPGGSFGHNPCSHTPLPILPTPSSVRLRILKRPRARATHLKLCLPRPVGRGSRAQSHHRDCWLWAASAVGRPSCWSAPASSSSTLTTVWVTLSSLNCHATTALADVGTAKVRCAPRALQAIALFVQVDSRVELWRRCGAPSGCRLGRQ
jgi:hypothetical protein